MELDNLLITKGFSKIDDYLEELDIPFIRGLIIILIFLGLLWFVGYFLIFGLISGYWLRTVSLVGLWLFCELAYFIGGGHNNRSSYV